MFQWDEAEYATLGRSLLRGDGFSIAGTPNYYRLPVVPAAAAMALALSGGERDAVVLRVTLAFACIALLLVYGFAAAEYGRLTGLAAAALLGMQPAFWESTPFLLTEIPFLAFFGAALFSFHRGLARDPRWLMASAAFAAVALHTRYTGSSDRAARPGLLRRHGSDYAAAAPSTCCAGANSGSRSRSAECSSLPG